MNNRQKELYEYLLKNTDKYVSKKQICKDLSYAYPRHLENHNNEGNKSRAYSNISSDIRALNDSDIELIIIFKKGLNGGYKIANEDEANKYIQCRFKRDFKSLKLNRKLVQKIGRNHQLYISENDIKEIRTFLGESYGS